MERTEGAAVTWGASCAKQAVGWLLSSSLPRGVSAPGGPGARVSLEVRDARPTGTARHPPCIAGMCFEFRTRPKHRPNRRAHAAAGPSPHCFVHQNSLSSPGSRDALSSRHPPREMTHRAVEQEFGNVRAFSAFIHAIVKKMRRVVHHILLGLLFIGLLGPMTACAWSVAARTGMLEEEKEVLKELAIFRSAPRLTARGTKPSRSPLHRWRTQRSVARVSPPAQTLRPRMTVVRRPLLLGAEDDPHH